MVGEPVGLGMSGDLGVWACGRRNFSFLAPPPSLFSAMCDLIPSFGVSNASPERTLPSLFYHLTPYILYARVP